jgi:hypothetical protein
MERIFGEAEWLGDGKEREDSARPRLRRADCLRFAHPAEASRSSVARWLEELKANRLRGFENLEGLEATMLRCLEKLRG